LVIPYPLLKDTDFLSQFFLACVYLRFQGTYITLRSADAVLDVIPYGTYFRLHVIPEILFDVIYVRLDVIYVLHEFPKMSDN
jgi:hypothetical protein